MSTSINRRNFMVGSGTALAALGLSPVSRLFAAEPNDNAMASQLYNGIAKELSLTNFQMLALNKTLNLMPAVNQIDPDLYQFVSTVPEWSPLGGYFSRAVSVWDAVRQIVPLVTWKLGAEYGADQRKFAAALIDKQKSMNAAEQAMYEGYDLARQNGGLKFRSLYPDFGAWIAKAPSAKGLQQTYDQAAEVFAAASKPKTNLEKSAMPKDLQNAIDAMEKPTGKVADTDAPAGWARVTDAAGVLRWQPAWTVPTARDVAASLVNTDKKSITLSSAQSDSNYTTSFVGGRPSYSQFGSFIKVGTSGSWDKTDYFSQAASLSIELSWEAGNIARVTPGDWFPRGFQKSLVQNASQSENTVGYKLLQPWVIMGGRGSQAFFGQYGLLSGLVNALVVIRRPSVKVKMDAAAFQAAKQVITANTAVRIGPFSFGGSGSRTDLSRNSWTANNELVCIGQSNDPQIIGVTVEFPG